jgi:hypothetical protein
MQDCCVGPSGSRELWHLQVYYEHAASDAYKCVPLIHALLTANIQEPLGTMTLSSL